MVLPDHQIQGLSITHKLIDPFTLDQLQPASYDVLLAQNILIPRSPKILSSNPDHRIVDLCEPMPDDVYMAIDIEETDGWILYPGGFLLASTSEWVNIPTDIVGRIEGKSTRARQGVQIHSAGYLDPGFRGNVTLELVSFFHRPVKLHAGMKIGQLSFDRLGSAAQYPYGHERVGSHYQDSIGVRSSS